MDVYSQLQRLISIGAMLTSVHDLDLLLDMIVSEARNFCDADAGSLYIVEGDHLSFRVSQCETLKLRGGAESAAFKPFHLPLTKKSLAGYVALTGEVLNIPDVYALQVDAEYSHNKQFDEKNDYRTRSMLILPMVEPQGRVIGVLQLINAMGPDGASAPFDSGYEELLLSLASQAAVAVSNAQLNTALREAQFETIYRLGVAAEYKDEDTGAHIRRVSEYSGLIASRLGLAPDVVEMIRYGSPMHDVGKLRIPDAVLLKPGKLDAEERRIMEMHTVYGAEILGNPRSDVLAWSQSIALTHHERWDGKGYPRGLAGEAIPIEGRVVALADVFDALSNKRCYKPAIPLPEVREIMLGGRGSQFAPGAIDAFLDVWDEVVGIFDSLKDRTADEVAPSSQT